MSQKIFVNQTVEALRGIRDSNADFATKIHQAARQYVMSGMYVVPIDKNSKKLPPKDKGVNYGNATCDLAVVDKWFHPDHGEFAGYNLGIACGREGGTFAVDCDKHGHGDGVKIYEEALKRHNIVHNGPIQLTPNGGKHYLYLWRENAISSTGKIDKGIDTRGGDRFACRSHILAFPSKVNGKEYAWSQWGPLGNIPKFVADKLGVAWKSMPTNQAIEIAESENEKPLTGTQLEQVLEHIDPDKLDYEEWLRVGQAINSQIPDEAGLKLWDEWSKKGKRYRPKECYIRWHGFNPHGPIKAGTLIYYAQQNGWEPPEDWPKIDRLGQYIEEINKEFALVKMGDDYKVLWDHRKKDPIRPPYEFFSMESFVTHMANKKVLLMTSKGAREIPLAKIWSSHPARRIYENGMDMLPNSNKVGVYNTWAGWTVTPKEGDCSIYTGHIFEVICSNNKEHYEWVLDWMADAIQEPENPKGVALVIKGIEGAGKGLFANGFGSLFGYHYKHLQTDEPLVGRFNAHLADALLVFADEILWGGNRKAAGRLKTLVTERHLSIERKQKDMTTYTNLMRLIIASNEEWVVPAGPESRRWFVLEASNHRRDDFEYFARIDAFLKGEGLNHILHFLMNRKIKNNLRLAPQTEALVYQRALHASQDSFGVWINQLLESGAYTTMFNDNKFETKDAIGTVKSGSRVLKQELFNHYIEWCKQAKLHFMSSTAFWIRMRNKLGIDNFVRSGKAGKRVTMVILPEPEELMITYNRAYGLIIGEINGKS